MKTLVLLAFVLCGILCAAQQVAPPLADSKTDSQTAQSSEHPELDQLAKLSDGTYCKQGDKFIAIDPLMMAGGGAKHMGKMFVPGLTPQMVWTYRGAEAPFRTTELRPVFYVKRPAVMSGIAGQSYRDVVIVRFDKKKDHRELQTTSGGNMFTFKAGISKEKLPDIETVKLSDSVFKITPKQDLAAGEYLIAFGMAASGYDFGIDVPKK